MVLGPLKRWPRRHRERIDPFALGEPWRHNVREALQAQARYHRAVAELGAGPLQERLEEIGGRVEEAVRECWRIAQRGNALDDVLSTLGTAAIRRRLAARTEAASPGLAEDPVAASLRAQLAAAGRMDAVVADAREQLGILDARLGEAVATAVVMSALAGDAADTTRLCSDVELVVQDLAALSSALDETSGLGT